MKSNANTLTFGPPTGPWGTVVGYGWRNPVSGDYLAWFPLAEQITPDDEDTVEWPPGSFAFEVVAMHDELENMFEDAFLGDHHSDHFPDPVECVLFTTMPARDGTGGAEPVGNGYDRLTVANDSGEWPDSDGS